MAIIATKSEGGNFATLEAGSYAARCYSMVHIGTNKEIILGKEKVLNKIRVTWEIPSEKAEFKTGEGEKPYIVSKEYTLSLHEKANLRKDLESWRGKAYNEEELEKVDVTKLIGAACMISIIHKEVGQKTYLQVNGISKMPKGLICEPQINPSFEFSYDMPVAILNAKIETLPDFIKDKIRTSDEWKLANGQIETEKHLNDDFPEDDLNGDKGLPF